VGGDLLLSDVRLALLLVRPAKLQGLLVLLLRQEAR